MGIIQQAMLADRRIYSTRELIENQMQTIQTVYEHHAISEAEYNRSLAFLNRQLGSLNPYEKHEKLSDIIGNFRNQYA